MLGATRKNEIKNLLLKNKSVKVVELAEKFEVSVETIRRDLKELESEGVAERIHGGAILTQKVSSSFTNEYLKEMLTDNKKAMARMVTPFIKSGYCIFLDASTTTHHLVKELEYLKNLVVVTNSLDVMVSCSKKDNIKLISMGGELDKKYLSFLGIETFEKMSQLYFDVTVISCRTLEQLHGLTDSSIETAKFKAAAISRAKNVILLADHTKFDKTSFYQITDFQNIDVLVTDNPVTDQWKAFLEEQQVDLRVAYEG